MASYTVTLITPSATKTIQCLDDEYILQISEQNKCRTSLCGT